MKQHVLSTLIVFILASGLALAGHDDTTVGSSPSWDANLTYLGTFSGNDSAASIFAAIGVNVMEIAKSDPPGTSINGLSMTCDGGCASDSGTWSYTGTEAVAFLVVKAGDSFAIYAVNAGVTSGNWETSDIVTGGGNHPEISHLTIYKTVSVPEPGSLGLLLAGLFGLGFLKRRL